MSVGKVLAKVAAYKELIVLVVQLVRTVEEAIPESGVGSAKLKLVLDGIADAWDAFEEFFGSFADYAPKLIDRIGSIVRAFNAASVFKKA